MDNKKSKSIGNGETKDEAKDLKLLLDLFDLSLKDLKTKIEVYSQDYQGRKLVIGKRFYTAEDLVLGKANDMFNTIMVRAIEDEFKVTSRDIMHFGYPDQNMNPKTIIISITNYVEKERTNKK